MSSQYDEMLTVLHECAPRAKILAVGYPTVIPQDTSKCRYDDLEQFGSITRGDLDWLRQDVVEPLNRAIEKSTATQDSASFVNLYDSSANHSVCDTDKRGDGTPTRLPDQVALVHPNARGHRNAADHVESAMLDAIS